MQKGKKLTCMKANGEECDRIGILLFLVVVVLV